jgi:hypothetical protein
LPHIACRCSIHVLLGPSRRSSMAHHEHDGMMAPTGHTQCEPARPWMRARPHPAAAPRPQLANTVRERG